MPSSGPSVPSNFCGERGWTHEQGPLLSQEPSTLNTKPESYPRVIFGMFLMSKEWEGGTKIEPPFIPCLILPSLPIVTRLFQLFYL